MAIVRFLSAAVLTLFLTSWSCDAWTKDIKVRYYGTAILRCHENETVIPNARVFWITPDASIIEQNTTDSQLPTNVIKVNGTVISMLNVTKVDDDQFGYYTCVMVSNNPVDSVTLVRWGLNVDGADFSDLEKQYRDNAIVGAIAAAIMLVLLGGGCFIWHFRYSRRERDRNGRSSIEDDPKKTSVQLYNPAFDDSAADTENVETPEDKVNGSTSAAVVTEAVTTVEDDQQGDGYETFRM